MLMIGCTPSLPADGGAGASGRGGTSGSTGGASGSTGGTSGSTGGASGSTGGTSGSTGGASGSEGGSGGSVAGASGSAGHGASGGALGTGGAVGGATGTGGATGSGGTAGGSGVAGGNGAGGATAAGGATGAGGAGAKGGAGGAAAGMAGTAGAGGAAGTGGTGAGGVAGSGGTGAKGGAGGAAGTTGTAGAGGAAGTAATGTGGAAGAPGCAAGFTDCNGFTTDGCETETRNNVAHCGTCGQSCSAGEMCFNGTCSTKALAFETPEGGDNLITTYGYAVQPGSIAVDGNDVPHFGYALWDVVDQVGDAGGAVVIRKRTGPNTWVTLTNTGFSTYSYEGIPEYSIPSLGNGPGKSVCYAAAEPFTANFIYGCVGTVGHSIITSGAMAESSIVSFEVDPLGTPILAYGPPGLSVQYTTKAMVDTATVAELQQLMVRQAPTGELHVAYLLPTTNVSPQVGRVRHALWNGTTWTTDDVDATAIGEAGCVSLAVDSHSQPHVLYANTTTNTIMLADWNPTTSKWQASTVRGLQTSLGEKGIYSCALALDANDVPHVAYDMMGQSGYLVELGYGVYNGVDWSVATKTGTNVLSVCGSNGRMEMALDSTGTPHIAWGGSCGASSYATME